MFLYAIQLVANVGNSWLVILFIEQIKRLFSKGLMLEKGLVSEEGLVSEGLLSEGLRSEEA